MTPPHGSMFRATARWALFALVPISSAVVLAQGGCLVTEYCYEHSDCPSPQRCGDDGTCEFECTTDDDCGETMACEGRVCRPKSEQPIVCPQDMVNVAEAFCVDRYEASRPDATETSSGNDERLAVSRQGVMPWQLLPPAGNAEAQAACQAAGKDLCTPQQWQAACEGPQRTTYGYGNQYAPTTCNGIDTFGQSGFHLLPAGELEGCTNGWGAFDMNGNLWEHVLGGNDTTLRGGAYNCSDSRTFHRCDYIPGSWTPSARGFRCCLVPSGALPDASVPDASVADVSVDAPDGESGCVEPDASVDPADVLADTSGDTADGPSAKRFRFGKDPS